MSHYHEHLGESFGTNRTSEQIEYDFLHVNKNMMHRVAPITGILDEEFGYLRVGDMLVRNEDRMKFHISKIDKKKIHLHNGAKQNRIYLLLKLKKVKRDFVKFKV